MSDLKIRQANSDDAAQIGVVMDSVWPDSVTDVERIVNVIQAESHMTLVAVDEGQVAGFVDGFMTTHADGVRRWEVDLLAVRPDFQRRGIASALVDTSNKWASERGAGLARGLVAVGNTGSERAFARCDYVTDGIVHELVVGSSVEAVNTAVDVSEGTHLITVHTINYSGVWVEGERTARGLQKALAYASDMQLDVAGAVIPVEQAALITEAIEQGYEKIGRYQWWERPIRG